MKIYWLISVLLGPALLAGELEVRAYRVEAKHFKQWVEAGEGPVTSLLEGAVYEGIPMGEAPFESRFFSEGDDLRDFTGWARGFGLLKSDEGKAVFNEATRRLVVRAELSDHYFLGDYLEQFLVGQIRFGIRVVRMPGVALGRMDLSLAKVEKEGELVAGISALCQSGRSFELRTPGGELSWEGECQAGFPDTSWVCRSNLDCRFRGMKFDLRHGVTGVMGLPTIMELGSFDGKSTLVGIWDVKQVLVDGSDFDDWVQAETPKNVVMEARVKGWLHKDKEWVAVEGGKRYRRFILPPTFLTFMGAEDDGTESVRDLFRKNGVDLQADDRLLWVPSASVLIVVASPLTIELIEGITMAAGQDGNSGLLGGSYALVESKKRLKVADLKDGEFRILRKICLSGEPGQSSTMKMGKRFLEVESECQANGDDHFVEARLTLRAKGKLVLKTAAEAEVGVPVILTQEKTGRKWRTWVVTFSARYFEDTIKEGR